MRTIIIASHGKLASGFANTLELIMGKCDNLEILCGYVNDDNIEEQISFIMNKHRNDELIVITDLFGGSINNIFMQYLGRTNFYLIAGMNLSLIMEIVCCLEQDNLQAMLNTAINNAKSSIKLCNNISNFDTNIDDF